MGVLQKQTPHPINYIDGFNTINLKQRREDIEFEKQNSFAVVYDRCHGGICLHGI
jgi:hypothetical protein